MNFFFLISIWTPQNAIWLSCDALPFNFWESDVCMKVGQFVSSVLLILRIKWACTDGRSMLLDRFYVIMQFCTYMVVIYCHIFLYVTSLSCILCTCSGIKYTYVCYLEGDKSLQLVPCGAINRYSTYVTIWYNMVLEDVCIEGDHRLPHCTLHGIKCT